MAIELYYIGHSAFFIKKDETGILIDPFIKHNPLAKVTFPMESVKYIFVTHGHSDHLGDAIEISKTTNAPIFAVHELANYCISKGAKAVGAGLGGNLKFNFGSVRFLPAFHSSSTPEGGYAGCPVSFLFDFKDTKIYYAGDTCLNSEMKMIGELYKPDTAILPIGGHYTMDVEDAALAADWLKAYRFIPMHYNTFPPINANAQEFANLIEYKDRICEIMIPGAKIEF